ncbi:hypothetical protein FB45DRAFT_360345 [Roridomyces roridus]|uniref:F-box domain-containing protein n=1 Tax=Roridomyces roridus TaxID=1738132 RepID=A0AAD7FVN7_9AGAR|nr:hypothetical protein FB45DRAFT_360345 [Roridomyces roridus]
MEIASEIFTQCLPPHPRPGIHRVPGIFLHVCHAWASIATSTPTLWATIRIDFPCANGSEKTVEGWLERAGSCALDITLAGFIHPEVVSMIWRWSEQLETLQILLAETERVDEDDYASGVREFLGGMDPGFLPSLKTLVVRCEDRVGCLWSEILDLLRGSPNLADAVLDCIDALDEVDESMEEVVLPNLRRMTFGRHSGLPVGNDELLKVITAPQLETLTLAMERVDDDDLTSFLLRSSPPLQDLILAKCRLLAMERGLSTVARLGLWSPHPRELILVQAVGPAAFHSGLTPQPPTSGSSFRLYSYD